MTSEEIAIWEKEFDKNNDSFKDQGATYRLDKKATQASALIEIAYQLAVMNEREALKQLKTHLNPESEWGGDNEVTSGN